MEKKSIEDRFNEVIERNFWGSYYDNLETGRKNVTLEWWDVHGVGIGKRVYEAKGDSIVGKARLCLLSLLDENLLEALTCNDAFVREYTKVYMEDKKNVG